jgi:hypothetical protein
MIEKAGKAVTQADAEDGVRRAEAALNGIAGNTVTMMRFVEGTFGPSDHGASVRAVLNMAHALRDAGTSQLEPLLLAQALALNAVFGEMSRRAANCMQQGPDQAERFLRLGLKAQAQSRATLEAIAAIRNPAVFARQANIVHNGPQQVVNRVKGKSKTKGLCVASKTERGARARKAIQSEPIELLEVKSDEAIRLDR